MVFEDVLEDRLFDLGVLDLVVADLLQRFEVLLRFLVLESVDLEMPEDHRGNLADELEVGLLDLDLNVNDSVPCRFPFKLSAYHPQYCS